jgi:hypothetical protein
MAGFVDKLFSEIIVLRELDPLSPENAEFERKSGINLLHVKCGLYSSYFIRPVNINVRKYYQALLENRITFHLNDTQKELARQIVKDNIVHIYINGEYKNVDEDEQFILVVAATATLALLQTPQQKNAEQLFFSFIDQYDDGAGGLPSIKDTNWYKARKVNILQDGIVLGAYEED